MKRMEWSLVAGLFATVMLSSCLKEIDTELITYHDTGITSFAISAAKQVVNTKSTSGADSTYVKELEANDYHFYIDQLKKEIYNPDSLPKGVNATKLICTITAKNGGIVMLKSITSDSLRLFNSTDSLDFSVPRTLIVLNQSNTDSTHYTVKVNVHQEDGSEFKWEQHTKNNALLIGISNAKVLTNAQNIFIFANKDNVGKIYKASMLEPNNWQEVQPNVALSTLFSSNIVLKNGIFYAIENDELLSSADAQTWTKTTVNNIKQLIGASTEKLYALSADGKIMVSTDNGATWNAETLDSDAALLPQTDINFIVQPLRTNKDANQLLMIGNKNPMVCTWGKVEENIQNAQNQAWIYYTPATNSGNILPYLNQLQVINYNQKLVAWGIAGSTLSKIYESVDGGINWKESLSLAYPQEINNQTTAISTTVDAEQYIWIVCNGSGNVWKGRLTQLGWAVNNKEFTE